MNKELLDFMTWVNQDKKLGYTSIGIERIVNKYITSKERYNQIIDEVYKNFEKDCIPGTGKKMSKEEFVNICKINPEFSEKWGLKIEERELSLEERRKLAKYDSEFVSPMTVESWDRNNIPTKLITLTYNNETIESYE
jgi:hypothetical protein